MAYNEKLANRVREVFAGLQGVEEQYKMGGVSFMLDDKMCVRVFNDDIMLRCEPAMTTELLAKTGARRFEVRNRPQMDGWLMISPEGTTEKNDFDFWMNIALEYNKKAKASPKRKKK